MNCKIKITTTQTDYKGKSIFDRAAEELMISESFSSGDDGETIETTLYGTIENKNGDVSIRYDEETEGMNGVHTLVKFSADAKNEVSIVRSGAIEAFMYFEEKKRHVCVYNTGYMPFEICIFTSRINNEIEEDGTLELEYLIEIKGACAQKTVFRMEVEKI